MAPQCNSRKPSAQAARLCCSFAVIRAGDRADELSTEKKPDLWSGSRNASFLAETTAGLVRHHNVIDHVNHAVRLKNVGDRNQSHSTFLVLEHDVLAVVQRDPKLAAFDGRQFC